MAVFILGDTAISYGAYTQEILIVVVMANVGNFVTSSYEVSMANKISRLFFVVGIMFFGIAGFFVTAFLHFLVLVTSRSEARPYLYPLILFHG